MFDEVRVRCIRRPFKASKVVVPLHEFQDCTSGVDRSVVLLDQILTVFDQIFCETNCVIYKQHQGPLQHAG